MALHLLQRDRGGGTHLGNILGHAGMRDVRQCRVCRNLTETEFVAYATTRGATVACSVVVESPADVLAVEQAGGYRGYYFVLHGKLSPIDGIGPEEQVWNCCKSE